MSTKIDTGRIITALLVLLCTLASLDLWRQYAINSSDYWYLQYALAVRSSDKFWKLGFRLEDLEIKLESQKQHYASITQTINNIAPRFSLAPKSLRPNLADDVSLTRRSRLAVHNLLNNETSVGQVRCGTDGPLLRVGLNDFRTDTRDMCGLFASTGAEDQSGPHSMFEMVYLDEGAFSLKFLGNGLYLQAVPPPRESLTLPWKIVVGGPIPGAAERFRYTDEGYLYSHLMNGFFTCKGGEMVTGSHYDDYKITTQTVFRFQAVSDANVRRALEIVHLSDQIRSIQSTYKANNQRNATRKETANIGSKNSDILKICIGVPMTSKGTKMEGVLDSPFWTNLFDSFMKSIDWRSNRFVFKFYLGFDKADELYDTGDAWSDMRVEFKRRSAFRLKEQLIDESTIDDILLNRLSLKIMHFDHLTGSPTQVVSQLMLAGYADNFDYFYQVNDDTVIVTPNWAVKLVETLALNPSIPNFGVTGPSDSNNDKIFTHGFVHRTHLEVFGHLFPPSFKNWWSDDWITTVYGSEHTFRVPDVVIKHNVGAQKQHGFTRYEVDKIDNWLKKNSLPRLPLPVVCGYIPLARLLTKSLKAPTPPPTRSPSKQGQDSSDIDGSPDSTEYDDKDNGDKKKDKEKEEEEKGEDVLIETKKPVIPEMTEESLSKILGWK